MVPVISIGTGMSFPNINALISMQAGPQAQGQVFGINQSIQSIALALPPIISGYITHIDMNLPIIVSFVVLVLAWLLFNLLYKPDAPTSKIN
jgi:DHA1 family tetracycline resistance protein-like MFS transporter